MKEIRLANKGVCLIDDEDYEKVNHYKWALNGGYAHTNIILDGTKTITEEGTIRRSFIMGNLDTKILFL